MFSLADCSDSQRRSWGMNPSFGTSARPLQEPSAETSLMVNMGLNFPFVSPQQEPSPTHVVPLQQSFQMQTQPSFPARRLSGVLKLFQLNFPDSQPRLLRTLKLSLDCDCHLLELVGLRGERMKDKDRHLWLTYCCMPIPCLASNRVCFSCSQIPNQATQVASLSDACRRLPLSKSPMPPTPSE